MPLNDLLNEVMRLKAAGKKTKMLSDEASEKDYRVSAAIDARKDNGQGIKSLIAYGLGSKHGNAYFTRREAECMVLLLKGKAINSVANILKLSPRTVEYYIKNMKAKLGCRTKFDLVDLVYASEFMKNVDF